MLIYIGCFVLGILLGFVLIALGFVVVLQMDQRKRRKSRAAALDKEMEESTFHYNTKYASAVYLERWHKAMPWQPRETIRCPQNWFHI